MTGLGIAGAGRLGEALIKEVPRIPGLQVVAIQDANLARAHEVAGRHSIPWSGQEYEDLLLVEGVDGVAVCTPNALHAGQAQAALRAGKHVLVQKPLALSLGDAQATIEVAMQADRVLVVDYSYRFLETVAALHDTIDRPVRAASAVFHNIYGPGAERTWFFDPRLSGGRALVDLGVHLLDLGLWLLAPREAMLLNTDLSGIGPIEHAASLRIALDGVPFDVDVSWNAPRSQTRIAFEALLDDGASVSWENVDGSFFHFRTLRDGVVLVDRETSLREDTLRAFKQAVSLGAAPSIDTRVYALLDRAYGRAP